MIESSREKLHHHAISAIIGFWDLILKTKNVYNKKSTEKKFILHDWMFESSRKKLHNHAISAIFDFWDLIIKTKKFRITKRLNKNCKEKKIEKTKLHHMMHKSSRRSYIIRLSRKRFAFETWLWRQKMSRIKKVEKINLHHKMYESSRKSYIIMLSRKLSIFEKRLWN